MPEARMFTPTLDIDIVLFELLGTEWSRQSEVVRAADRELRRRGRPKTERAVRLRIERLEEDGWLERKQVGRPWLVRRKPGMRIRLPRPPQETRSQAQVSDADRAHWEQLRTEFLPAMERQLPAVRLEGVFDVHGGRPNLPYTAATALPFERDPFFGCLPRHVPSDEDPTQSWREFKREVRRYWPQRQRLARETLALLSGQGFPVQGDLRENSAPPHAPDLVLSLVQLIGTESPMAHAFRQGVVPSRRLKRDGGRVEEVPEEGTRFVFKVAGQVVFVGGLARGAFEDRARKAWSVIVAWAQGEGLQQAQPFKRSFLRLRRLRGETLRRLERCKRRGSPIGTCESA